MRLSDLLKTFLNSLTAQFLAYVLAYAAFVIALFLVVGYVADARLNSAFPSIDVALEHEEVLRNDQFEDLVSEVPKSCQMLVFDAHGQRLFASNQEIAQKITANDLPIIKSYEEDLSFYEILEGVDEQGETYYTIALCTYNDEDNTKLIKSYCILNSDLEIVEGTLFAGHTSLTQDEFSLIKGVYESKMTIEKYEYETFEGEGRTLVFAAPFVNGASYDAVVTEVGNIRLTAIPVALAATVVMILFLSRMIRRSMQPLDKAIDARKQHDGAVQNQEDLPLELQPTYENFADLMGQLDTEKQDKQRIIADVSHDLKTPLTVIQGYAQAFADGQVDQAKRASYIKAMGEKSFEANQLLDSLFAFSKAEHPDFKPSPSEVDLGEATRAVLINTVDEIEQAGCILDVDIDQKPVYAYIDQQLYARMLSNLISNACKHNPAGTRILVSCTYQQKQATIIVADTGKGIPEHLRNTAFKPFVTSNDARELGKGTGLGLAIAHRYAQLNNATFHFAHDVAPPYVTKVVIEMPAWQIQRNL